jgi:HPr kinase/phosphorylase
MKDPHAHQTAITVADFLKHGAGELKMELAEGAEFLSRRITEAAINRPGLALSGFFRYFAHRRIQVIGLAEHTYLSSLPVEERRRRLREFFARKVPCVVVSRSKSVFREMRDYAREYGVPVLRTAMITKHFVNAATLIMENLSAPHVKVQGTMVEIMGIGVLIEGQPGLGKSEAALALIKRGHALVSDDITAMRVDSSGALIGSAVSVTRYHLEIRGVGIVHVPSLFGVAAVREEKKVDMVATLIHADARLAEEDRGGQRSPAREILGVAVPRVLIRVVPGRDLSNVIETAALDLKLRHLGHDAAKELDQRLIDMMVGGHVASD